MVLYVPVDQVEEFDDNTYKVEITDFDYRNAELFGINLYLSGPSTGPEGGPIRFYLGDGPEVPGDELKAHLSDFVDLVATVYLRAS